MGSIYDFDEFELDPDRQELRRAGEAIKIDGLLLRLLEVLVRSPGQLITKHELVTQVWRGRAVSENALTVAMTRLRKTLAHERGSRELVLTVHGHGYRFVPAVAVRARPEPGTGDGSAGAGHAPFVGRERVMGYLDSALKEARSGSGSAIALTGAPGIGKTRVAEMLAREAAAAGVPVAWAHCRELGDTPPLWPFAGLLREAISQLPRDASMRDPRFLALVPELARLLPELASEGERAALPRQATRPALKLASKHRVFDAVTRALALFAERTPYVLIVDDLNRADDPSLELLGYFLSELPRMRALLLTTMRSDGESAAKPALTSVLNHRNCTRIALQPLSEAQVASYVVALLGTAAPQLCRAVFEKSEGNPLFMSELARQLRDSERPDVTALTTPSVALELVRQRIAGLDRAERDVLTGAAVIGRSFGLPLLQAITGRDASEVMTRLDRAVAREVIVVARDSPTEFRFAHDLFRAALYEALEPAERRGWHVRAVQALDPRVALGEAPAADLAYHARAALPDGDLRKAVDHCVAAADEAARVYAYSDAARFLQHARQALDLIEGGSARLRFRLLWRQASYVRGYSAQEFRPLAEQLVRLAHELGTGTALAQAAILLDSFPGFPQLPGARDALAAALARLPEDAQVMRAAVLARLATSAPLAYDAAASGAQLDHALELARTSPELGERLTVGFAELYGYGGPAHEARAAPALQSMQDICTESAATLIMPLVLLDVHRALRAAQEGDLATMTRALDRCEARGREFDIELLWHIERFRALARINAGHAGEGRAALRALHQRAAGAGAIAGAELFCAYDHAVVLGDAASNPWARALTADPDDLPNLWALKVRALAAAGSLAEARSALSAVPARALTKLPCDREYLGTLGALARAVLALRAPDYAAVVYELLSPYPERFALNLAFLCEGSVSQLLGLLARSFGEPARAARHFEAAVAACEQAGYAPCAAEARRELAEC